MTPTEIRVSFNETIDYYRRTWGSARTKAAKLVLSALETHPWLNDQIPYSVLESAQKDVRSESSAVPTPAAKAKRDSGFACMECGHRFRTLKGAERAMLGPNGCPKCGGADVDLRCAS